MTFWNCHICPKKFDTLRELNRHCFKKVVKDGGIIFVPRHGRQRARAAKVAIAEFRVLARAMEWFEKRRDGSTVFQQALSAVELGKACRALGRFSTKER